MKKFLSIILCLCVAVSFAACGKTPEELLAERQQAYTDFKADWGQQDILAINAKVETDENGDKLLMADIKNNSADEISDIVLTFAAWDAQGNFIILKSKNNPLNTYSELQMDVGDVTVAGGKTWIADRGLYLAESCPEIAYVEAAVISCKTGDSTYSNTLYEAWKQTYLDQTLEDWMKTPEEELAAVRQQTYTAFKADWDKQSIAAVNARVTTDDNGSKLLMADIKNDSAEDISAMVLSFAAWDAQGNFIILKTKSTPDNPFAEFQMDLGDITVANGQTWEADCGLYLAEECPEIAYVEAALVSCSMGEPTYNNDLYPAWKQLYLGHPLETWMKAGNN